MREDRSDESIHRIIQIWMDRDVESFIEYVQRRGPSARRNRNYHISLDEPLIAHLARRSPEAAWDVADRLPGPPATRQWSIVSTLAAKDPSAAAEFVRAHKSELSSASQAYGGWYQLDPIEMMPVVEALVDGSAKSNLVYELSRFYLDANDLDAAAAAEWFNGLDEFQQKLIERRIKDTALQSLSSQPENVDVLRRLWKVPDPAADGAK
jgi:hypothetical protein